MKLTYILLLIVILTLSTQSFAGFIDGLSAYNTGDYATALREWKVLANKGDAEAQNRLGIMYKYGKGVVQDTAEANKWFRKAADQGDIIAQYNMLPQPKDRGYNLTWTKVSTIGPDGSGPIVFRSEAGQIVQFQDHYKLTDQITVKDSVLSSVTDHCQCIAKKLWGDNIAGIRATLQWALFLVQDGRGDEVVDQAKLCVAQ